MRRSMPNALLAAAVGCLLLAHGAAGQQRPFWSGTSWQPGAAQAGAADSSPGVVQLLPPDQPTMQPQPLPFPLPGQPQATIAPQPARCSLLSVLRTTPNATFFVEAVQAAGLSGMLADPSFQATVFVPSDRAFDNLLKVLRYSKGQLLDQQSQGALMAVLQYHIVRNQALGIPQLAIMDFLERLPTLYNQQPLMVYNEQGLSGVSGVKLAGTSRQIANVVRQLDTRTCPGLPAVAHLIDAVVPPDPAWQDELAAASQVQLLEVEQEVPPAEVMGQLLDAEPLAGTASSAVPVDEQLPPMEVLGLQGAQEPELVPLGTAG